MYVVFNLTVPFTFTQSAVWFGKELPKVATRRSGRFRENLLPTVHKMNCPMFIKIKQNNNNFEGLPSIWKLRAFSLSQ